MNWVIFPLAIHSDAIAKCLPLMVTPNSGSTFGWLRLFHVITSLQNLYEITINALIRTRIERFGE
jgi:hypothetical protein